MSDELKACPFCGNTCVLLDEPINPDSYAVFCNGLCGAVGPEDDDGEEAIKLWNTRPLEDALRSRVEELEKEKNNAYSERDKLVAALSKCYPSVLGRHEESDTEWEQDWRWIVFINTPAGQVSWHIHDTELGMFDHLPRISNNPWDGHTTEEKYNRLEKIPFQDTWIGHLQERVEELERERKQIADNLSDPDDIVVIANNLRTMRLLSDNANLQAELARLREQVRWRNYPEEKPNKPGDYWCEIASAVDVGKIYEDALNYNDGWGTYARVSRWTFLPQPPEVE